ncbi:MAG: hypothetical protein V1754_03915, partial [Pseudomonadota bacterium]
LLVFRVWRKHWFKAAGFYVLATTVIALFSGLVLATWRQYPPQSFISVWYWGIGWFCVLVLQIYVWYWLLHASRLLYKGQCSRDHL